ncbi:MAG: hypothetical protein PHH67_00040 [Methanosarcina sp.]|jgi:hypothetical protein|nr:hypothetical protein [Methanosarcina sp.]MDD3318331.1 hypothetical protein [Methanosarcina sp.]MDD4304897.1 hypothetical protein [Methanosarcina sp.]MDD4619763.1 hypothetical protein [Methanosarcina sp.]NLN42991.1 hypothetical protein [Methanosarcina sp.]
MCEKQKSELLQPDVVLADTLINSCTREFLDGTGDIYIKFTSKLYQRSNGSRYMNVSWFVSGCQTTSKEFQFPAPCEMTVTIWISEPINLPAIVHQVPSSCTASGAETIDVPSNGSYKTNVKLEAKCYAYLPAKILIANRENSCNCVI